MAVSVATGTVTISTGAAGTTFDVTGLAGFDTSSKKAVLFIWSGRATAGFGEADAKYGVGFFTGTASRRAYTTQNDHANGTSSNDSVMRNDCCIATLTAAGATDGLADIDSIITDGFRLIVDDAFAAAQVVGYLAIWGADLTDCEIVDIAAPNSTTGNQDITTSFSLGGGSDNKALVIVGGTDGAANTPAGWSVFSCGVVAGNTPAQAVLMGVSQDAAPNMITFGYGISGECLAMGFNTDQVNQRASVTGWDVSGNGFRLNYAENTLNNVKYAALVLKGPNFAVGDILSRTDTTQTDEVVGFDPKALIVGSHCKAASTSDTTAAHDERSLGFVTGAAARVCASMCDQDTPTTSDVAIGLTTDRIYDNIDVTASAKAVEGAMDLIDFTVSGGGFTFVMDDADPSATFVWYLAIGDTPSAGGAASAGTLLVPTDMRAKMGNQGFFQ